MTDLDVWFSMAKSDPAAWRKRGNPITERLALSLSADAELSMDGEAGRDCKRVAAGLLQEADGDEGLILKAQERCRRDSGWRGLGLYVQRKALVHEMSRVRAARRQFVSLLGTDEVAEEDPLVKCKKCGKMVLPEREADDCKGH